MVGRDRIRRAGCQKAKGEEMNITPQQLRTVFPKCRDPNLWALTLSKVADEFEINTKDRFAAWLAQAGHESAEFNTLRENLSYSMLGITKTWPKRFPTEDSAKPFERQPERLANYVYAGRFGNGDFASGDGWRFRGGGIFQLTFRGNYRDTGKAIGVPLEAQPVKITEPLVAARTAGYFWKAHGCNELSDARDLDKITETINGPAKLGAEARALNLAKLLTVLQ